MNSWQRHAREGRRVGKLQEHGVLECHSPWPHFLAVLAPSFRCHINMTCSLENAQKKKRPKPSTAPELGLLTQDHVNEGMLTPMSPCSKNSLTASAHAFHIASAHDHGRPMCSKLSVTTR